MLMLFDKVAVFFFKQKTAYEMRISDWSSDVCSSDLPLILTSCVNGALMPVELEQAIEAAWERREKITPADADLRETVGRAIELLDGGMARVAEPDGAGGWKVNQRSEEHTSELQSLMRSSYAVFSLKKKTTRRSIRREE